MLLVLALLTPLVLLLLAAVEGSSNIPRLFEIVADITNFTFGGSSRGSHASEASVLSSDIKRWTPSMTTIIFPLRLARSKNRGSSHDKRSCRVGTSRPISNRCFKSTIRRRIRLFTLVDCREHPTACQNTNSVVLNRCPLRNRRSNQFDKSADLPIPDSPMTNRGARDDEMPCPPESMPACE
jgi:hypothetical protein